MRGIKNVISSGLSGGIRIAEIEHARPVAARGIDKPCFKGYAGKSGNQTAGQIDVVAVAVKVHRVVADVGVALQRTVLSSDGVHCRSTVTISETVAMNQVPSDNSAQA